MTQIPKAVCVPCQRPMTILETGATLEMFVDDYGRPYYKIQCDVYECPDCGHQVIAGFAKGPIIFEHQSDYKDKFPPSHMASW